MREIAIACGVHAVDSMAQKCHGHCIGIECALVRRCVYTLRQPADDAEAASPEVLRKLVSIFCASAGRISAAYNRQGRQVKSVGVTDNI